MLVVFRSASEPPGMTGAGLLVFSPKLKRYTIKFIVYVDIEGDLKGAVTGKVHCQSVWDAFHPVGLNKPSVIGLCWS